MQNKTNSQVIFKTKRLLVRKMQMEDLDCFFDLMGNPNVMRPIPLKELSRKESELKLHEIVTDQNFDSKKRIWAVSLINKPELIGLCAFLKNDESNPEIGYRFRESYWNRGYGTEIAEALISYGFSSLNMDLITADVWIKNKKSMIILKKFMIFVKEFKNPVNLMTEHRYQVQKGMWDSRRLNKKD